MVDIYQELGLSTPAITMTGCQVVDANGQVLWERRMDPADAQLLVDWADSSGHSLVAVRNSGDAVANYQAPDFAPWGVWNRFTRVVGPLAAHLQGQSPLAMALYGARACAAAAQIVPELPTTLWTHWAPRPEEQVMFLWHRESDKGRALAGFCRRRGYSPAEVVAMGDAHIDIPMLTWAGIGVAMPGASAEVRAAAKIQIEPGDPHPVRTALIRLGILPPGGAP